jgi:Zn-dependent protease
VSLAEFFPILIHELFPGYSTDLPAWQYWIMDLITALAFFICILLHELGHAVVARAHGMSIRGITLFLFGGVAEISDEPPSAATEFFLAIAGPLVTVSPADGILPPE